MSVRQAVSLILAVFLTSGYVFAQSPTRQVVAERPNDRQVDLELILAVDVSRSMNTRRLKLQRQGYVAAFRDQGVLQAIMSGPQGRIAITYVEWSGAKHQNVIVPWRVISSRSDALAFARDLEGETTMRTRRTSISAMMHKASELFNSSG